MNLILLFPEDFPAGPDRVRLQGRRFQHVRSVHRAKAGDELRVGLLNGPVGRGRVVELTDDRLDMEVHLDQPPPAPLPVTLLLALPRPKVVRRAVQAAAVLGVKHIVLLNAWRVEKSYWQSPFLAPEALHEQLCLALEQARDTVLPRIEVETRFKPFVEDRLPALVAGSRALAAHPEAVRPCPRDVGDRVTLAVGPEGGFTTYELAALATAGFEAVSLGDRILRVEQAIPALLGRLY